LFPLSLRMRFRHLRFATPSHFFNSRFFAWGLLLVPVGLLAAILIAHTQLTPITGRKRVLLLTKQEERQILNAFTEGTSVGLVVVPEQIHYYHILRKLLGEQDAETGTLLGGKVLVDDWRESWIKQALQRLESGLANITTSSQIHCSEDLTVPPARQPMSVCDEAHPYTVLVIDRPETNAFSFGWQPDTEMPFGIKKGVVCVFTGFLDYILQTNPPSLLSPAQLSGGQEAPPITEEQTKQLSVLLSHELSHLVLGHTLETYVTNILLWPQLQRIAVDVLRTITYPVTALFGPFFNDSIFMSSSLLSQPSRDGAPSACEQLCSSCASHTMEIEADLVSLRLLASAGVDPREALKFWQRRLAADHSDVSFPLEPATTTTEDEAYQHGVAKLRMHSDPMKHANASETSFLQTHPVDQVRLQAIKKELARWERGKNKEGPFSHLLSPFTTTTF